MKADQAVTVICRYTVKAGHEAEMENLLSKHWPALHAQGLVTEDRPKIYRGLASKKPGSTPGAEFVYIEIFAWKSEDAPATAHQLPEVMAVWEPMGAICDQMDFPHFKLLNLLPA